MVAFQVVDVPYLGSLVALTEPNEYPRLHDESRQTLSDCPGWVSQKVQCSDAFSFNKRLPWDAMAYRYGLYTAHTYACTHTTHMHTQHTTHGY